VAFDPSEIRGAFGGMQLRGRGRDSGARTAVDPRKKAAMLSKKRTAIGRLKTGRHAASAHENALFWWCDSSIVLCLLTFQKTWKRQKF